MNYRPEIDGLRAIAVIPVVLFHYAGLSFSGGFVGVDIFFVISGYLITKIIYEGALSDSFRLSNFYLKRIKRIFPALLVVTTVTYLVSSLVYPPDLHKVVGQYVFSTMSSLTNVLLFVKGTDYFGLHSGANPLYHSWSLSVEEQFYLLFPLIFLTTYRWGAHWLSYFLVAAFLTSFTLTMVGSVFFPLANYFMLSSRAWELLAGSLCAVYVVKYGYFNFKFLTTGGLVLIVFSFVLIDETTVFPGLMTIAPVLGAVIFILNVDSNSYSSRLLSSKYFVYLGLLSYSIYLWHLPLFVYMNYLFNLENSDFLFYSVILLALSYCSYKFVELPFRSSSRNWMILCVTAFTVMTLSIFSIVGHFNGGYPNRSEMFQNLSHNNGFGLQCNGNSLIQENCSSSSEPKYALLGNSYAMVWLDSLKQQEIGGVVQLTRDSCAVGYEDRVHSFGDISCPDFYEQAVHSINNSPSVERVIIASPFDKEISSQKFHDSFTQLLEDIASESITVIGPPPRAPFDVGQCQIRKKIKLESKTCNFSPSSDHIQKVRELDHFFRSFENIEFIDITRIVCEMNICEMNLSDNDPVYIDDGHLSRNGAAYIYSRLRESSNF